MLVSHADRQVIRIASTGPLKPGLVRGDEASGLGWLSPAFGVRIPTEQILRRSSLQTLDYHN